MAEGIRDLGGFMRMVSHDGLVQGREGGDGDCCLAASRELAVTGGWSLVD